MRKLRLRGYTACPRPYRNRVRLNPHYVSPPESMILSILPHCLWLSPLSNMTLFTPKPLKYPQPYFSPRLREPHRLFLWPLCTDVLCTVYISPSRFSLCHSFPCWVLRESVLCGQPLARFPLLLVVWVNGRCQEREDGQGISSPSPFLLGHCGVSASAH